jgi:hypothetical protein
MQRESLAASDFPMTRADEAADEVWLAALRCRALDLGDAVQALCRVRRNMSVIITACLP